MTMSAEVVPTWDEKTMTLDAFEQKVSRYVKGTRKDERYLCANRILSKFDPDRLLYKTIIRTVAEDVLEKDDGSGCFELVKALRSGLGPHTVQEAVRAFQDLLALKDLQRSPRETMLKWSGRFVEGVNKVGIALHAAEPSISSTEYLHPVLRGIMLLTASGLGPSEQAAVLVTSGDPEHINSPRQRNSHHVDGLTRSLCAQWSDDAIFKRDQGYKRQKAQANALSDMISLQQTLPEVNREYYAQSGGDYEQEVDLPFWEEEEPVFGGFEDESDIALKEYEYWEEQFGSVEDAENYAAET